MPADACFNAGDTGAIEAGKGYCIAECDTDADCPLRLRRRGSATRGCAVLLGLQRRKTLLPVGERASRTCRGSGCTGSTAHSRTCPTRSSTGEAAFECFATTLAFGYGGTGWRAGLEAARMALDTEFVDPLTGRNLSITRGVPPAGGAAGGLHLDGTTAASDPLTR